MYSPAPVVFDAGVPIPPKAWEYDTFVDLSRQIVMGKTPCELWDAVVGLLLGLMPPFILPILRKAIKPVKWVCEGNAIIAVQAFGWLVGPMKRSEVEVNGEMMRSNVKILRCRYLEVRTVARPTKRTNLCLLERVWPARYTRAGTVGD